MKKVIKKAVAKAPVKKTVAKKPMMKSGGAKKPLRKAQYGDTIMGTPSLKDVGVKNIYQGPLNKSDYENLNTLYPVNNESPRLEPTVMAPRAVQKDKSVMGPKVKMYESAANQYMQDRIANYLRSGKTLDSDDSGVYKPRERDLYSVEGKKRGGAKKPMMKKGGSVKKYKTGGSAKAVKATANNAATNTSKKTPTKIPAKPVKRTLPPAPKPKTGMDALKALGKYITTFGFATEGYNPAPSKKAKKTMKNGGGIKAKKK